MTPVTGQFNGTFILQARSLHDKAIHSLPVDLARNSLKSI